MAMLGVAHDGRLHVLEPEEQGKTVCGLATRGLITMMYPAWLSEFLDDRGRCPECLIKVSSRAPAPASPLRSWLVAG